jgi:hypothetical protein
MLSKAYGGEPIKKSSVFEWHNSSEKFGMSKSQIKDNAHNFLQYQGYYYSEFIP